MKCRACNYRTDGAEHPNSIICKLTNEEHSLGFDCNCESIRVRRDSEARLLAEKETVAKTLAALKDKLAGPQLDLPYVYRTLHEIREEVDSAKLEELIQYLEGYL